MKELMKINNESGLIIVNKPAGFTSRDVVNKLNKILKTKKIGHTGTLDPMATGVLVCLVGKYTKLVDLITSLKKEYVAEITLGIKTDTLDTEGKILEKSSCEVSKEKIIESFSRFPNVYEQTVPKYSAVKINGKKLYEYARSNESVDLPKRKVEIYELEILDISNNKIKFRCVVSKGTYIRSLISDLCESMDTIGVMSSLCRTKQGRFSITDSYTLENIENNDYRILNVKEFLDYPIIELDENMFNLVKNGNKIKNNYGIQDKVIFTYLKEDIAIYECEKETLKPYIMF